METERSSQITSNVPFNKDIKDLIKVDKPGATKACADSKVNPKESSLGVDTIARRSFCNRLD
jgi:hypothetical protein